MNSLNILTLSDIHLGHRKTHTQFIIHNLNHALTDALLADLDLIVIVGDLFDQLLDLGQEEVHDIDAWICNLLRKCKHFGIKLWVLEGTRSHDEKQSRRVPALNTAARIDAQVKYVGKIEVYYDPDFQRHFLFVPDEATASVEETWRQVQAALKAKDLTQVDAAFMHGAFRYQFPDIPTIPTHSEEHYLGIVKHFISIGHVHAFSTHERIYAQGSVDRLGHGYESPKGFVKIVLHAQSYEMQFIENTGAKRYDTYVLDSLDMEASLQLIDARVKLLPDDSHVRLQMARAHPLVKAMDVIIRRHPGMHWSTKLIEDKVKEKEKTAKKTPYVPLVITRDNIASLIMEALRVRPDMTPALLQIAQDQLTLEER